MNENENFQDERDRIKDNLIKELTKAKQTYDQMLEDLQKKHDEADEVLRQAYQLIQELKKKTGKTDE